LSTPLTTNGKSEIVRSCSQRHTSPNATLEGLRARSVIDRWVREPGSDRCIPRPSQRPSSPCSELPEIEQHVPRCADDEP
jgi:hypothetical protein